MGRERVFKKGRGRRFRLLVARPEVLDSQGRYDKAEVMYREVLQLREKVLGCDHPDTLKSVNNLADMLYRLGKYNEAEAMHDRRSS